MNALSAIASVTALGTTTGFQWGDYITNSTFQPLIDGIVSLLPVVIATVIPLIVIRKGWSFITGSIYSA